MSNHSNDQVTLFVLRPSKSHFKYILFKHQNESYPQAIERYKSLLLQSAIVTNDFSPQQTDQLQPGQISQLSQTTQLRTLLLANRGYDLTNDIKTNGALRIDELDAKLIKSENYVLPPLATLGLTPNERQSAHQQLVDNFNTVIALGGADVDPSLYEEENKGARNTFALRDKLEIDFIRFWINSKKGLLIGICRGHQLIAVALGYKLNQHIENHGDGHWTTHKVNVTNSKYNPLTKIFNFSRFTVNSYHHESSSNAKTNNSQTSTIVSPIIEADDGTIEGLADTEGRILTFQSHFEFFKNYIGKKLFSYIYNQSLELKKLYNQENQKIKTCSVLFN